MSTALGSSTTADEVLNGRDLTGKNMLITGCNAGIGFETARSLAAHGAHVFVACRDLAKASDTIARIRAAHPNAKLSPVALDLSSFASIRQAVASVNVDALHVLICNAGLYMDKYKATAEGLESTVGVCHHGHFLLTQLLLDKLRKGAPARVVMVSSESHRYPARLSLEHLPLSAQNFKSLVAYGQAKLSNILFANELTRRYRAEGILANSLHPGSMIGTSIFRNSLSAKLVGLAIRPFAKSIEQGAATTVYCATSPELSDVGGKYYRDCHEHRMSRAASDADLAKRLWDLTETFVAKHPAQA
ncbi:MAG TPA: SDR family NAD(P)-dependent oxidoreductase [Polyangiales bacterium]|nr:SDR family NAD(P)-dependent oxidoreductase [Polyangiales bacterium]